MHGKPLPSLWPLAVVLAAMIAMVAVATARQSDGQRNAGEGAVRAPAALEPGLPERRQVRP